MVGVTGTNGKTTTAFLDAPRARGGRASRPGCSARCTRWSAAASRRSSARRRRRSTCRRRFARMLEAGDQACVMEVSSHALELHRAAGIEFDCAVFTNLTQDHLDFHGTLDAYYAAKRRLFLPADGRRAGGRRRERRRRVGPHGSPASSRDAGSAAVVTFARRAATPTTAPRDVRYDAAGSSFECATRGGRRRGAAAAAGPVQRLQRARRDRRGAARWACRSTRPRPRSESAQRVPGRFEPVDEGQGFGVLVDYAHTPDSLENVLVVRARAARAGGRRGPADRACSARAATATGRSAR